MNIKLKCLLVLVVGCATQVVISKNSVNKSNLSSTKNVFLNTSSNSNLTSNNHNHPLPSSKLKSSNKTRKHGKKKRKNSKTIQENGSQGNKLTQSKPLNWYTSSSTTREPFRAFLKDSSEFTTQINAATTDNMPSVGTSTTEIIYCTTESLITEIFKSLHSTNKPMSFKSSSTYSSVEYFPTSSSKVSSEDAFDDTANLDRQITTSTPELSLVTHSSNKPSTTDLNTESALTENSINDDTKNAIDKAKKLPQVGNAEEGYKPQQATTTQYPDQISEAITSHIKLHHRKHKHVTTTTTSAPIDFSTEQEDKYGPPFKCIPTPPRLNLRIDMVLGEWYPANISAGTFKLLGQSFENEHNTGILGCPLIEFSATSKNDSLYISLKNRGLSTRVEADFMGDGLHPRESKWLVSWPNGEDTLTSVVAAGKLGKDRSRYSWLFTVDCDLSEAVESDWAVLGRKSEGFSENALKTILSIVEGHGFNMDNFKTYKPSDCY